MQEGTNRREPKGKTAQDTVFDNAADFLNTRYIRDIVRKRKGSRVDVLDIGCGYNAKVMRAIEPYITSGTCLDFSVAPEVREHPKLVCMEGEASELLSGMGSGSWDVILLISVLEHLFEPEGLLSECFRLLRTNGVLVINVPTWRGKAFLELLAFKLRIYYAYRSEIEDHRNYFRFENLWPMLRRTGFRPSDIRIRKRKLGLTLFATATKSDQARVNT